MSWPHAAAGRLLGECPHRPFSTEGIPDPAHSPTVAAVLRQQRHEEQRSRDGWMRAAGQLAARLEAAGWRGRLAARLLGVR